MPCRPPLVVSLVAAVLLAVAAAAQPSAVATEFVRLTTADGLRTAGLIQTPAGRVPRGGVVLVHGYASNF